MLRDTLKLLGSIFSLDLVASGGQLALGVLSAVASVLLGNPELVVAALSSLNRLGEYIPIIPESLVKQLLTAGLVAMTGLYLIKLGSRVIDKI